MNTKIECVEETNKNWDDFANYLKEKKNTKFLFRGTLESWGLRSTIERIREAWDIPFDNLPRIEKRIIRDFQRKYPNYLTILRPDKDILWWISLMRHHGAPTRMLDWTYSPYVAAYFAFESYLYKYNNNANEDDRAVVWMIDRNWLDDVSQSKIRIMFRLRTDRGLVQDIRDSLPSAFDRLFNVKKPKYDFLCALNPWHINERLAVQQGIFLYPTNISKPFQDNLTQMDGYEKYLVRFIFKNLNVNELRDIFENLYRMNINRTSLFPGLDGYAKSLETRIRFFFEDKIEIKKYYPPE